MTQKNKIVLRGLLLSALVPAIGAMIISPFLSVSVFIAAFVLASVLGYPLFRLASRYSYANGWVASAVGLVIGAVAGGWTFFPLSNPEMKTTSWHGSDTSRIYNMIDGVPTQEAWNDFYLAFAVFSAFGLFSGLVFWVATRKRSELTSPT